MNHKLFTTSLALLSGLALMLVTFCLLGGARVPASAHATVPSPLNTSGITINFD